MAATPVAGVLATTDNNLARLTLADDRNGSYLAANQLGSRALGDLARPCWGGTRVDAILSCSGPDPREDGDHGRLRAVRNSCLDSIGGSVSDEF